MYSEVYVRDNETIFVERITPDKVIVRYLVDKDRYSESPVCIEITENDFKEIYLKRGFRINRGYEQ